MGLRDKATSKKKPLPKKVGAPSSLEKNKLSEDELRILLRLLRETTFKGSDVENIYNLVQKIQNQFEDWLK